MTGAEEGDPGRADGVEAGVGAVTDDIVGRRPIDVGPATLPEALARLAEAEDTLRAIRSGEVDAFVIDGGAGRRVFTLSTADRPYRMFVENMRDGAATVSSGGLILYANRRLSEMLELSRETIVGAPLTRLVADGVDLAPILQPGCFGVAVEIDLVGAGDRTVPVRVGSSPLEVDGDELTCLTFTDVGARKAQEREIARLGKAQEERLLDLQRAQAALLEQANHDALTGLPNRTLLLDRINQAVYAAERSARCIAVFFVDLDGFKLINDTYGHAAGDGVLRRVAGQLVGALRPMDTVARIGGDEFVVLAPDVDSHLHAVDIGERLVHELGHGPVPPDGEWVTASVGISVSLGGRGTAEDLLNEADTAMYKAKSLGGGRAAAFDATLGRQVRERLDTQRMLRRAIDEHRIIVRYQPVVDLRTGKVIGFEALARISGPGGAILPPASFIPDAEDSGLVVPLGAEVLGLACAEAGGWQPEEGSQRRLSVAVNLSARQFEAGDLARLVQDQLERTDLDARCLHLELTETAIIDLRPDILRQLGGIRDLGVQIGLDDFGTGYASLTHLRRLPLTFVKIDQSFVEGIDTEGEDDRIVSAVVDLAANLGLRSIAEGVETTQQLVRLRELGCDEAQGYHFAQPLAADAVPTAIGHAAW